MTIKSISSEDILEDLRRGDHIIFSLNAQGIHPDDNVGYSFVNRVIEEYTAEFKATKTRDFGKIVTVEADEYQCWFHGIVNHDITDGWPDYEELWQPNSYRAITAALDALEEEFQPTLPMKSLWLGRGKMRKIGEQPGDIIKAIQAIANAEAEIKVYIDGDLDD